ncbi:MAG: hypothetical protein VYB40_04485, partial [Candidatus Thermoplasmatota archaeon]|nr:hypothetical protein [Candidatus Thermoplasmatota archaeon]
VGGAGGSMPGGIGGVGGAGGSMPGGIGGAGGAGGIPGGGVGTFPSSFSSLIAIPPSTKGLGCYSTVLEAV